MSTKHILDWNYYLETARKTVAEGCVLLENRNHVLPLNKGTRVSIFGRIQNHYYKSGTGSGGMVNVSKVTNIVECLQESGDVVINETLLKIYQDWEESHPFDKGMGWGCEPWSQE
ncbi:MAG: glycoside hydrolase family 3 C-terminal domain-containing protein, partial [Lachnospiraceae bacterium]|nr:glycoside hydrolase family 3 C-terminal domain-containing protein [Lachnospiraceae bacterium]